MKTCATVLSSLLFSAAALAQTLPSGEYQTHRARDYDLRHYRADLEFDFAKRRISGQATLELGFLRPVERLEIDAIGLEIEEVTLAATRRLEFTHRGNTLEITWPSDVVVKDSYLLTIDYSATPRAGMYFQPSRDNNDLYYVSTYGEGGLHANWLPIYNDTNDRFSTEMAVTVPPPYVVVSNGVLIGKSDTEDGRHTYHWRQNLPHPNYLISLYVGDFEMGTLEPALGNIPLRYWVPRGRLAEGAHAFRNTKRMVEFFSEKFDYRYPWDKYDQIAVPDYAIGAMEHTGVTGHNVSVLRHAGKAPLDFGGPTFEEYWTDWSAEATISHELAHHWFGNLVTCRHLSQIWLNESFASYLMMLWDEESVSREQLDFDVELARRHYFEFVDADHMIRPLEYHYYDDADAIFNTEHTYLKGAAVLHMLRGILGDNDFFGGLADYLDQHEYGNVESEDLRRALEAKSGRNLRFFFDDWVYGGGHPRFEVSYRYLEDRRAIDLEIVQVQPLVEGQGLFTLPVEITVTTPSRTWTETVWVRDAVEKVLLAADEAPLMVSFDGGGLLVAEIDFAKGLEELIYQAEHDALAGRLRAFHQLAADFPGDNVSLEVLERTMTGNAFWALRAEAAELLGAVRGTAAENVAEKALADADYRVRKAAALGLTYFGTDTAAALLRRVVAEDTMSDVVGTAVLALARVDPELETSFLEAQLERGAWYDEIRIAALQAAAELARPELVELVRPYAGPSFNQAVRLAGLEAWEAARPRDPELHKALLDLADGPIYVLQKFALERLGELYVKEAVALLEDLVARDVDANLTVAARAALEEIRRVHGTKPLG